MKKNKTIITHDEASNILKEELKELRELVKMVWSQPTSKWVKDLIKRGPYCSAGQTITKPIKYKEGE